MKTERKRRLSRVTLIVVAVMFLTPFIIALILNRTGWHPDATRNHGELIEPPQHLGGMVLSDRGGQSLPLINLDRRWTYVVRVPTACDDHCLARLDELYRVRQSLHRHAPKLAIRLLTPSPPPQLPDSLRALDDASIASLESAAPRIAQAPDWSAFLIDAKSFLMMHFPPDLEARLIRRDLGRLVK